MELRLRQCTFNATLYSRILASFLGSAALDRAWRTSCLFKIGESERAAGGSSEVSVESLPTDSSQSAVPACADTLAQTIVNFSLVKLYRHLTPLSKTIYTKLRTDKTKSGNPYEFHTGSNGSGGENKHDHKQHHVTDQECDSFEQEFGREKRPNHQMSPLNRCAGCSCHRGQAAACHKNERCPQQPLAHAGSIGSELIHSGTTFNASRMNPDAAGRGAAIAGSAITTCASSPSRGATTPATLPCLAAHGLYPRLQRPVQGRLASPKQARELGA